MRAGVGVKRMSSDRQQAPGATESLKRTLSVRSRLVILALVAVAPLIVDRVRLLEADRAERIGAASQAALDLARQGAERQGEVVAEARALLRVVARTGVTRMNAPEECGRFLADVVVDVPWIKGLSVVGPSGRIACSTFPNAVGVDLSDRDYIQRAIATGGFVMSDYVVGRMVGEPTIVAALPTRRADGEIQAVIIAGIDLQWIGRLVATVGQRPGSMVLLVDGVGTVLTAQPTREKWIGRRFADHPLISDMLARSHGTVTTTGLDGVRRIFGFLRLPGTDAHLAIGLKESEALGRVDREMSIAYANFAFVCAIVLIGVGFGGERLIIQPIRALARTAARFGRGNLTARATSTPWAAEFAPLAAALDDMAQKLATREEELHIANAHLGELASLDGLSGLANRRSFDADLETEWRRAAKSQRVIALLMIDVDHFKLFNDHSGHVEGDECLRRVGEVIGVAAANGAYLAARYGGEEFALLLPGADAETAIAVAELLRKAVEDLDIANATAPLGRVTVSVGVASLRPEAEHGAQALVEAADAALYAAKRGGRNAVAAHQSERYLLAS